MNGFKKLLLAISAVLGITLLLSGLLLLNQMDGILGVNEVASDQEIQEERPLTVEQQQRIDELPESVGYVLHRNFTDYQIELFEQLVHAHYRFEETDADGDLLDYASIIARNFVADFFTLSNKNSRADVGGLQFFSDDIIDDFRSFAIDDFYLYLNQHIETFGRESLPTVVSTTVLEVGFDTRIFEIEEDENVADEDLEFDEFGQLLGRGERTIIVDVAWTYGNSTLAYIDEFQTSARIELLLSDDGLRIYVIEEIPEELPYQQW